MKVSVIEHDKESRVKVEFDNSVEKIAKLRKIKDCRWSSTLKAWHIPNTREAREQLSLFFAEEHRENDNVESKQKPVNTTTQKQFPPISGNEMPILIHVLGKKIVIRIPKNESDILFIRNLKYSNWDKRNLCWTLPNYPGNLDILKNYFGQRITSLTIEDIIYEKEGAPRTIAHNEILFIKGSNGRMKLIGVYNKEINEALKNIHYKKWDSRNKWWSFPYTEIYCDIIRKVCDLTGLKLIMEVEIEKEKGKSRPSPVDLPNFRECPQEYILKLKELRYSESTIKSYTDLFREFINYHFRYDIKNIDEPTIIAYLRYLVMERKVSASYQNLAINAIKFYYERVLGGHRKFYFVERPSKEQKLPVVLSEDEVRRILHCTENLKHKAILMTTYSAGLRIGEIIDLKIKDIDSQRMQIRIGDSKGNKDRYTILSPKTLDILRKYFVAYKPKQWLFEGQKGEQYSASSIQNILKKSAQLAKIKKSISMHTLRHSFATHLLEQGTDIRYIQSLLGHNNVKTTEIYTHITTRAISQIKSPLDRLDL